MAQIGTIKVQTQNNGTVSVPIFETGDSDSSVHEFLRVETASGTGFIPLVAPTEASFPYVRVQSQNSGIVAFHDSASLGPIVTSGLQVHYTFNNDSTDGSTLFDQASNGGNFNATIEDATTGATSDIEGESFFFDGSNDRVSNTNTALSGGGDHTIAMWVYPQDDDRGDPYRSHTGSFEDIALTYNANGNRHFQNTYSANNASARVKSTTTYSKGQWYHLVTTLDQFANTFEFFIDGTSVGTNSTDFYTDININAIGDKHNSGGKFNGKIDEWRLYDRVLSQSEIDTLANRTNY